MKKRFIDLFAGTGAFTHALENTGKYECVFANDFDKSSKEIYTNNHDSTFVLGDLNDIPVENIPEHDLLCGGFPCQPFSIAGDRKGFEDVRSNVFWKIVEILKHHKPQNIILENVKNLTSHDNGNTFKIIKTALEDCGYHIKYSKAYCHSRMRSKVESWLSILKRAKKVDPSAKKMTTASGRTFIRK